MKIQLSEASVSDAIQRLKTLQDNIKLANENIVEKLVDSGEQFAGYYNSLMTAAVGKNDSVIVPSKDLNGIKSKGTVALTGSNAVYYEFGTGEEGLKNPHPTKEQFGLNPYNSGPRIRVNKSGQHYWYVPKGKYIPSQYVRNNGYTQGVPAGKQMYMTAQHLRSIKKDIIKTELNGAIRKFK